MDGQRPTIIDTSTLINFLAVDRVDLLQATPRHLFHLTEHARAEVTYHYAEQHSRLAKAIEEGSLIESPVTGMAELELFARLASSRQLGQGECASIAAAVGRGMVLAMDDKFATKKARAMARNLIIINTQEIVVGLIRDGLIDVSSADALKARWAAEFRFVLRVKSFGGLL